MLFLATVISFCSIVFARDAAITIPDTTTVDPRIPVTTTVDPQLASWMIGFLGGQGGPSFNAYNPVARNVDPRVRSRFGFLGGHGGPLFYAYNQVATTFDPPFTVTSTGSEFDPVTTTVDPQVIEEPISHGWVI
jgi:hypothetical protein